MKWIEKVIETDNFKVKTLWNDGQIREINMEKFLKQKSKNPHSSYCQLLNIEIFKQVRCDGTTLVWENLIEFRDLDGSIKKGDLDISPELLFDLSNLNYKTII